MASIIAPKQPGVPPVKVVGGVPVNPKQNKCIEAAQAAIKASLSPPPAQPPPPVTGGVTSTVDCVSDVRWGVQIGPQTFSQMANPDWLWTPPPSTDAGTVAQQTMGLQSGISLPQGILAGFRAKSAYKEASALKDRAGKIEAGITLVRSGVQATAGTAFLGFRCVNIAQVLTTKASAALGVVGMVLGGVGISLFSVFFVMFGGLAGFQFAKNGSFYRELAAARKEGGDAAVLALRQKLATAQKQGRDVAVVDLLQQCALAAAQKKGEGAAVVVLLQQCALAATQKEGGYAAVVALLQQRALDAAQKEGGDTAVVALLQKKLERTSEDTWNALTPEEKANLREEGRKNLVDACMTTEQVRTREEVEEELTQNAELMRTLPSYQECIRFLGFNPGANADPFSVLGFATDETKRQIRLEKALAAVTSADCVEQVKSLNGRQIDKMDPKELTELAAMARNSNKKNILLYAGLVALAVIGVVTLVLITISVLATPVGAIYVATTLMTMLMLGGALLVDRYFAKAALGAPGPIGKYDKAYIKGCMGFTTLSFALSVVFVLLTATSAAAALSCLAPAVLIVLIAAFLYGSALGRLNARERKWLEAEEQRLEAEAKQAQEDLEKASLPAPNTNAPEPIQSPSGTGTAASETESRLSRVFRALTNFSHALHGEAETA